MNFGHHGGGWLDNRNKKKANKEKTEIRNRLDKMAKKGALLRRFKK